MAAMEKDGKEAAPAEEKPEAPKLDVLEEARKGDIYNTVTGSVLKGKDGVKVVPCAYQRRFIRWAPLGEGTGAPVAVVAIASSPLRASDTRGKGKRPGRRHTTQRKRGGGGSGGGDGRKGAEVASNKSGGRPYARRRWPARRGARAAQSVGRWRRRRAARRPSRPTSARAAWCSGRSGGASGR